jgi:hypothetical protein
VLGRKLQPYEAHLPYLLQMKIDLNLAGMGWLRLSHIHCRAPLPNRRAKRRCGWRDTPTLVQYEPQSTGAVAVHFHRHDFVYASSQERVSSLTVVLMAVQERALPVLLALLLPRTSFGLVRRCQRSGRCLL